MNAFEADTARVDVMATGPSENLEYGQPYSAGSQRRS
jgi:hypothetical protein